MKDAILTILGLLHYFFKYRNFNLKSQEFIEKYHFIKLKKLLLISQDVPYYKDLYGKINFNPKRDFKKISDLEKIPILKKEIVRSNPELFFHPSFKNKSIYFKTSGTTGTPFTAYVSYKHWIVEQAVIWRHWFLAGYKLFDSMAILRSHNPKSDSEIIKVDKLRNWTYYSPYHLNDDWMQLYYDDIISKKTKFLRGYPSSLYLFADFCSRKGYSIPSLKACLTASEVLTDKERLKIESTFNVQVFDHYGLAEAIVMLHNYGDRDLYKNCNEYGYLELIETEMENNFKIVGTNLNNFSMPLLRYDTEDIAERKANLQFKGEVSKIIGRKDVYIQMGEKKIPSVNFYTMLYKVEGITQWQIIQNNKNSLDIYLNIKQGFEFKNVTEQIDSLNNTGLFFFYHETTVFLLVSEGKFKPFISNL